MPIPIANHPIGPHFPEELHAAGLADVVASFVIGGTDADIYAPALTAPQETALVALIAAHNPTTPATPSAQQAATTAFQAFKFPSPETVDSAIDAIANLADAKVVLRKMAKAILYLARATGVDA